MFGLTIISLAAGLSAAEPVIFIDEQPTVHVQLAGYDLNNTDDQRKLHREVLRAADEVCKAAIPGAVQNELFACTKDTLTTANRQLNAILAQNRTGRSLVAALEVTAGNK